jgi:TRAP-type C4-dicarboxylate transport system permease small subunit
LRQVREISLMELSKLAKYPGRLVIATQKGILIFASLMLSGLMVTEVIARYFLDASIWGWEELAMICAMWLYMIGAAMAANDRSHIKTEIIQLMVKDGQSRRIIEALTTLITLVLAGFMIYWSFDLLLWGLKQRPETPVYGLPWTISQSSLFFASILITIYFLRDFIERVLSILHHGEPNSGRSG